MSSVTFSTTVGGDGSTVTDDDDATTGLRNGGWRTRFVPALTQEVAVAANAVASATAALSSKNAAAASASNAAASASNAATSASTASTQATNAANSASTASTQATAAGTSATNAATSATNASTSASTASTQATNAASSASSASGSATSASGSASTATTQAGIATTQATNASASASTATTQASNASTSATNAASSATAAAASYDSFDDRYLGAKTSDPTLDNDGNALLTGALYWNSIVNAMKVYTGSAWVNFNPASTGASIRPSLLLDFANSKTLDPRITFTRASTATYTGYDGLIKTAASGEARFDYNPTTGESLGLLIEEQRTNLLTYSENFDNAAWYKPRATVAANSTTSPDGTTTADTMTTVAGTNTDYFIANSSAITIGTTCTTSIFLKAGTAMRIRLDLCDDTNYSNRINCYLNLQTGLSDSATSVEGAAVSFGSSIADCGNGWYKLSVSGVVSPTSNRAALLLSIRDTITGNVVHTDIGGNYIYIWGAQLEQGAFATSYIPTTSAQATRAADNAVMTGTNFSSWYRQDEGTFAIKYKYENATNSSGNYPCTIDVNDGTFNNEIYQLTQSSDNFETFGIRSGNVTVADMYSSGSISTTNMNLVAGTYKANDFAKSLNALSPQTDSSGALPIGVTSMGIGYRMGFNWLNGHIAKVAYYPKRLSNAELQSITTG